MSKYILDFYVHYMTKFDTNIMSKLLKYSKFGLMAHDRLLRKAICRTASLGSQSINCSKKLPKNVIKLWVKSNMANGRVNYNQHICSVCQENVPYLDIEIKPKSHLTKVTLTLRLDMNHFYLPWPSFWPMKICLRKYMRISTSKARS